MMQILDQFFNLPVDPRSQNFLLFYCQIPVLVTCYAVLALVHFCVRRYVKTHRLKFDLDGLLLVYNGFMFGSYGLGLFVGIYSLDGLHHLMDCSEFDFHSTQLKAVLQHMICIAFHVYKLIKFMEPLLYLLAGKPSPVSTIAMLEQFLVHVLGFVVVRYYAANFFALTLVLDGITSVVFYARQTLSAGGSMVKPVKHWDWIISGLSILERVIPLVQAYFGLSESSCMRLRPLIKLQTAACVLIIIPLLLWDHINSEKEKKKRLIKKQQHCD